MAQQSVPSPGRRVLVVEDDPVINEQLVVRLRAEGYAVSTAYDGPSGVAAANADEPDVVVLDVMLPGFDGHEACRRIQAQRPVPVLMLTARDDEADILVGLAVGADDYLTKPFRMREVVARVSALLRRVERASELASGGSSEPPVLLVDGVRLDVGRRTVTVDAELVHLTPTEFDLLVVLARQAGQVVTREHLLGEVWGWSDPLFSAGRTVDSHIKALRSKLGAGRIRTVHGVGYALDDANEASS